MITIFIANILVIYGVYSAFSQGMIGEPVKIKLMSLVGKNWLKPVMICPVCMSSVWGAAGFLFTSLEWWYLPVWILALAGGIFLIIQFMPES